MKRKYSRTAKKRKSKSNRSPLSFMRKAGSTRRSQVQKRRHRRLPTPKNKLRSPLNKKALAALALMRREKLSLAKATRLEHIKPSTFLRYVGNAVIRSGPGKPWKAVRADRLAAMMTILTAQGPTTVVVRGSRERTLLARYDLAVMKWRAGEDGAEKLLLTFKGQTVGGHVLITNPDLLVQLEEAGQLDFDNLYYSVGGGS